MHTSETTKMHNFIFSLVVLEILKLTYLLELFKFNSSSRTLLNVSQAVGAGGHFLPAPSRLIHRVCRMEESLKSDNLSSVSLDLGVAIAVFP